MRTVFCGREAEMAVLQASFERISAGELPELAVITGDAGLGKTRLAQEFFNWLSTHHDGKGTTGYWPDTLDQRDNNLLVNPAPERCPAERDLPFLWWGMRLADPGKTNALTLGAVRGHLDFLKPHLETMYRARRMQHRKGEAAKSLGQAALDFIADCIPGLGMLKTVSETAYKFWTLSHERSSDQAAADLSVLGERERKSLNEGVLEDLAVLLGKTSDAARIPAVLFIDDGQFSPADPGATALLGELLDRAWAGGWPLMIIVTYWQAEWRAHLDGSEDSIARVIAARGQLLGANWRTIVLGPVADLRPALAKELPGLSPEQARALLDRAGGNPRYLEQMALLARGRPRYFEVRAPDGPMTAAGFSEFLSLTFDIQTMVEQRLKDAPENVQNALALSSLQGLKFLSALTVEVANALQISEAETGLRRAEQPLSFIKDVDTGLAEFAQRLFYEVAASILPDLPAIPGPEAARMALAAALRRRLENDEAWQTFSSVEKEQTFIAAANAFERAVAQEDRALAVRALGGLLEVALHGSTTPRLAALRVGFGRARAADPWGEPQNKATRAWMKAAVADFSRMCFQIEVSLRFDGFIFPGTALFEGALFSGYAGFEGAQFEREAEFWGAQFRANASFENAEFSEDAKFSMAKFAQFAQFAKASFSENANFSAIRGERGFSLADATFDEVPDFNQAHFEEAPRLDNIKVTSPKGAATDATSKYRALKRLAIQGHDHVRELQFFKYELQSRLANKEDPWSICLAIRAYGLLSDFGRSFMRPLGIWAALVLFFAGIYWLSARPYCPDGSWPSLHSIYLAAKNGLAVLSGAQDQRSTDAYLCLYGKQSIKPATVPDPHLPQVKPTATGNPAIPFAITCRKPSSFGSDHGWFFYVPQIRPAIFSANA